MNVIGTPSSRADLTAAGRVCDDVLQQLLPPEERPLLLRIVDPQTHRDAVMRGVAVCLLVLALMGALAFAGAA